MWLAAPNRPNRRRDAMFENDRLYRTNAPALSILATPGVMAQWRHHGTGPAYIKLGGRVLYRGGDLNAFLEARRVETASSRQAAA